MKKLKKVLSLVLVLAMALSMFGVCATATDVKDYSDYDDITYVEAVGVLSGLGVLKGDDTGTLRPTGTLKRAEAAAMIDRMLRVENNKVEAPTKFVDVADDYWGRNEIIIAESLGIIDGTSATTFEPENKLTGYAWEKMVLCALGYKSDVEGFTGDKWQGNVLKLVKKLGLRDGLSKDYDATKEITREEAAQIAFNALQNRPVFYEITGSSNSSAMPDLRYRSLGAREFGLTLSTNDDKWGRPGYKWTNGENTPDKEVVYYAWTLDPVIKPYTTAQTECDIASDLGLRAPTAVSVFMNGAAQANAKTITPTATRATVGAQGRLIEIYDVSDYEGDANKYRAVVIDTYLAQVKDVKDATADAAGHPDKMASLTMTVFVEQVNKTVKLEAPVNFPYDKDDYVLVNVYMGTKNEQSDILGIPETLDGSMTAYTTVPATTSIERVKYNDACKWVLNSDKTAPDATAKSTYFFDQYGNVIGRKTIEAIKSYGVIKNIQWKNPDLANGYAQATMVYMDGTEEVVKIDEINGYKTTYSTNSTDKAAGKWTDDPKVIYVSTSIADNDAAFAGVHLYEIENAPNGALKLSKVTPALDTIANGINVTPRVATITGGGTTKITGNSSTVYLVESVVNTPAGRKVTYTSYTGYNNVPAMKATDVHYVLNTPDNGYAKYVYISGTLNSVKTTGLFYTKNTAPSVEYVGPDAYYTYSGYVDGHEGTITSEGAPLELTADVLYKVAYENGYAKSVVAVEKAATGMTPISGYDAYTADYRDTKTVIELGEDATDDVLNGEYNITGVEPVVGAWTTDMSGKTVILVYTNDATKTVQQAYVYDTAALTSVKIEGIDAAYDAATMTWNVNVPYAKLTDTTDKWMEYTPSANAKAVVVKFNNSEWTEKDRTDSANATGWAGQTIVWTVEVTDQNNVTAEYTISAVCAAS